jgi:hypothetical protein
MSVPMNTSKLVVTRVSGAAYVMTGGASVPAATGMNLSKNPTGTTAPNGTAKRRHLRVVR